MYSNILIKYVIFSKTLLKENIMDKIEELDKEIRKIINKYPENTLTIIRNPCVHGTELYRILEADAKIVLIKSNDVEKYLYYLIHMAEYRRDIIICIYCEKNSPNVNTNILSDMLNTYVFNIKKMNRKTTSKLVKSINSILLKKHSSLKINYDKKVEYVLDMLKNSLKATTESPDFWACEIACANKSEINSISSFLEYDILSDRKISKILSMSYSKLNLNSDRMKNSIVKEKKRLAEHFYKTSVKFD